MKTEFRKSFEKDLAKLQDLKLLKKNKEVIEKVEGVENLESLRNLKKIKSKGNYYRIRLGNYRLGISFENNTVTFVRVLHRREIYQYFP